MMLSPQLNLNSVILFGEGVKPLTPEEPGLPLDAPSKNMAAEGEFILIKFNSSKVPRNCQEDALIGLLNAIFLKPRSLGPNHFMNEAAIGKENALLQIDSLIKILDLIGNRPPVRRNITEDAVILAKPNLPPNDLRNQMPEMISIRFISNF